MPLNANLLWQFPKALYVDGNSKHTCHHVIVIKGKHNDASRAISEFQSRKASIDRSVSINEHDSGYRAVASSLKLRKPLVGRHTILSSSTDIVGDARYIETAWDIQELNTFTSHCDMLECSERVSWKIRAALYFLEPSYATVALPPRSTEVHSSIVSTRTGEKLLDPVLGDDREGPKIEDHALTAEPNDEHSGLSMGGCLPPAEAIRLAFLAAY
ncbi:hypothetical protein LR48_Vigan10g207100 [Vigna angularis]|uniref:Uncharacterized protein n=1 Tax=Phaseolus angularis TaxID=3914 RepID=A0A0L9VN54_PHAAN|nr:hypothetical protein LR48_Vigan10g207100 [Vigna angularis]